MLGPSPSDGHLAGHRERSSAIQLGLTALLAIPAVGIGLLATITVHGPVSIASMSRLWAITFLGLAVACALWWIGYLWLLKRLAGWDWQRGLQASASLLLLLSMSILPSLAVFFSGKLPYSLPWNPDTQSLYLWITGTLLGTAVIGQEVILLQATQESGLSGLAGRVLGALGSLAAKAPRLPTWILRQARAHPVLTVVLLAGAVQRLMVLSDAHFGDMGVMLSVVFATLSWPPFGYYHYYRPQPWIYNHFPLFPMLIAPFYWVFENILNWPTVWSAKLMSAFADMAIAVMIYRQARGRRCGLWGLALAAAWLLPSWVVGSDDHAVGAAAAFTVAAVAAMETEWLAGVLLALGVATRNEAAFFVIPLLVQCAAHRGLARTAGFLGGFGTALILTVSPFILYDPEAIDYALRKHTEHIASAEVSAAFTFLQPYLDQAFAAALQQKQEILAFGLNLLVAPLALRDPRPARIALIAGAAYMLALPIVHMRYAVFAYSLALFYAVRYRNPLVAFLAIAWTWYGFPYGYYALPALFVLMILGSLARFGEPKVRPEPEVLS